MKRKKGFKCYSDLFAIKLSSDFTCNNNINSATDVASEVTKSFFGPLNRVFAPEHFLLTQLLQKSTNSSDRSPSSFESQLFHIGMKILFWTVVARSSNEIVLRWEWKGVSGYTLIGYDATRNTLYHGNLLPGGLPTGASSPLLKFGGRLLHRFHVLYARLLTAETARVFENRMLGNIKYP